MKRRERGETMPTERESTDVKKAMAYDILKTIEVSDKETFTKDDIKNIVDAYIVGLTQKS